MVRDLHTINTKRLCSGTHRRMRERTPTSYTRLSEKLIRTMPVMKLREATKYGGRKPKSKKRLTPSQVTQTHKPFSHLEGRVIRMADAFLPKKSTISSKPKVYSFKVDYAAPRLSGIYAGTVRPPGEYLGFDVMVEEKPKKEAESETEMKIISLDSMVGKGKPREDREPSETGQSYQEAA